MRGNATTSVLLPYRNGVLLGVRGGNLAPFFYCKKIEKTFRKPIDYISVYPYNKRGLKKGNKRKDKEQ